VHCDFGMQVAPCYSWVKIVPLLQEFFLLLALTPIFINHIGNRTFNAPAEFTIHFPISCSASLHLCVNFFISHDTFQEIVGCETSLCTEILKTNW